MKITRIEYIKVVVPMKPDSVHSVGFDDTLNPMNWRGVYFADMHKFFYRVCTDEGVEGLGESYRGVDESLVTRDIGMLIDHDPRALNLADLPIPKDRAYDGFEAALYDLVGKALNVPVWRLLGGKFRDRVAVDYWTGRRTPEDLARIAKHAQQQGFRGIKFKCSVEDPNVERAEAVQAACGSDFHIVFDPNERFYTCNQALGLARRLEAFNIDCFEDPLPRWDLSSYRLLREKTDIPIALHTHLPYGQQPSDALRAISMGAVDKLNFSGNMADFLRLTHIAEIAGIPVWHGSEVDCGVLDASYVHAAAAARGCTLGSDIIGNFLREDDLIVEPLQYEDGCVLVPEGPGLGVELDMEAVKRYRV